MRKLDLKQIIKEEIEKLFIEELIPEGVIELPKELTQKFGVLFDFLKNDLDRYIEKTVNTNHNNPLIAFKDYFKLTDKENKPISVSIGLYNDEEDEGAARMDAVNDVLLFNLDKFQPDNLDVFEDTIYHELVHSIDPLVRNSNVFSKYYYKKGAEPSGSKISVDKTTKSEYDKGLEKYMRSQHEYTAFLSSSIPLIKKRVGSDKYRLKLIMWLIDLVDDYNTPDELYQATHYHLNTMIESKLFVDESDYWKFINDLFYRTKHWVSDEKIMKKLKQDIYKSIMK